MGPKKFDKLVWNEAPFTPFTGSQLMVMMSHSVYIVALVEAEHAWAGA